MRGTIHHVDLTVLDSDASRPFYDAVLTFAGFQLSHQDPRGYAWRLSGDSGALSIAVMRAVGPGAARTHDRYSPGLHHLALRAESRKDVDAMHRLLLEIGATVLDAPADYPQYNRGRGYYAVFFADPDGLKLEFVHTPPI